LDFDSDSSFDIWHSVTEIATHLSGARNDTYVAGGDKPRLLVVIARHDSAEAISWRGCRAWRLPRFPFGMLRALAHPNDMPSSCHREARDSSLMLGTGSATSGTMGAVGNQYYVYIMTNSRNTVLYVGVTNDLIRRVYEHKEKLADGFTKRYNIVKLVYYEVLEDIENAILREKQIKAGSRRKKIQLINSMNKEWLDLYDEL
jgi:putative endonuclease